MDHVTLNNVKPAATAALFDDIVPVMSEDSRTRAEKFADMARELEADEDAEHFEETAGKIAPTVPIERLKTPD